MEFFQYLAELIRQQYSAGQQYASKPPVEDDHHNDHTDQLDHHSCQFGKNFDIDVSDHYRVIGKPIQPFTQMDGTHACEVISEDIVHQQSLEDIFKSCSGQLIPI